MADSGGRPKLGHEELRLTARNIRNFWAKVRRAGPDDCWPWTGACSGDGRPAFGVAGRQHPASHIALTLDGRPRPEWFSDNALHGDCSDPMCMNAAHLRWGTNEENVCDKQRLGRGNYLQGDESPVAKLTEADVRLIRSTPRKGVVLARELGVSPTTISMIRQRKTWRHVA